MKIWRLLSLISGIAILFLFISAFIISRDPLILLASYVGIYMVLGVLERDYCYYYNPELA